MTSWRGRLVIGSCLLFLAAWLYACTFVMGAPA